MRLRRSKVPFQGKAVTIICTDKARSAHFYSDLLGAELLPGDGYGCPWYRLGAITFSLLPNASETSPTSLIRTGTMLWLEVDNLSAAHRYLVKNYVPILEFHEGEWMIVTDPDGLLIEIWQSEPKSE